MATIGYTLFAGSGTDRTADNWASEATIGAAYRYTASSGDTVTQVAVYGHTGAGTNQCAVGVYVWDGTVPTTLIGSPVTISVASSTTPAWHTAAASIGLTGGVTYVVALDYQLALDSWNMYYIDLGSTSTSTSTSTTALASTWAQAGTSNFANTFYATVTSSGGAFAADGPLIIGTDAATRRAFTW